MSDKTLAHYLEEFSGIAGDWFDERPFAEEFNRFIKNFFKPENLKSAEWEDFQELANHLHSFNSVALAKGNAFGRPNYPIEKYRESFHFLAHGPGTVEERVRAFMDDNVNHTSKFLGKSVVSELIGQLFGDEFTFMNRRDVEAAEFVGIQVAHARGDDFPMRFIKFNAALSPLFDDYKRIVEQRTKAPIGIEIDQFLSWLYETKIPKQKSSPMSVTSGRQIWVLAPGPQASFWDECLSEGIAVMGWDEMGSLDSYASKGDVQKKLQELYPDEGTKQTNSALSNWQFCHEIKDGDLILAKRGTRKVLGAGIVRNDYRFDTNRTEYRHVRDVEWILNDEKLLPDGVNFATKTLTNITRHKDSVVKILALLEIDPESFFNAGQRHYWLNCSPDVWCVSKYDVGHEECFTTHNEKGNKRQVHACFKAAKSGDLVVGYETTPNQKVTSVLEVVEGIHEDENEGECIRLKILKHLDHPRELHDLRDEPSLADCAPVKGQQRGTLFQISNAEYETILGVGSSSTEDETGVDEAEPEFYSIDDALSDLFVDEETFKGWLSQWEANKNLILQGAPGVGKTFVARRLAYALMEEEDKSRVMTVQFHQSYGYEDFVQGFRPGKDGFTLSNGTFYEFCQKAKTDPRPHVFIIDEINRGNLSRIFGELLMLIESDKRGEEHSLRLAYQQEKQSFFVPENVHVLGMMNTADRSLAVVDYALRRRFVFATIPPAFASDKFRDFMIEACDQDLVDRVIARLKRLNEHIAKDVVNLGAGFCVGHSYFCKVKSIQDYHDVIDFQIAPLLREYWFDQQKTADERIQDLRAV